jgi:hypothetical protein
MHTQTAPATRPIAVESWPNLIFSEHGAKRLREVASMLDSLDRAEHGHAADIRACFIDRMDYLAEYGGPVSADDPRRRFRITLGHDRDPYSFGVFWDMLSLTTGEYRGWCTGGLIWHGGPGEASSVTLVAQWWGIHT